MFYLNRMNYPVFLPSLSTFTWHTLDQNLSRTIEF